MDAASPNKDTDGANGSDLNAPSITAAEVPVGNAGAATPVVLPSHVRSMVGQTAPSFARTQDDGVEAVPVVTGPVITAPLVIGEAASHAAATPKKRGKGSTQRASARAKAPSQRAAGKGPEKEKVARKGSYKHAAESLEQATKKTDQLLTSMSNRINSVKSTAETSAHELATLRDKLARLERRIDGILAERAVRADDAARADVVDEYDTGSESGGAQKRKAASSAGSRSPKRGRWETRGRSSEKGSQRGSIRSVSTDPASNREGSFRGDNDDAYEDGGERSESEEWDDSGTESEGRGSVGERRSVGERLAAEKKSLQERLQSPEGGRDDGRGHSARRERTRSASPPVRSKRGEKKVGRTKRRRSSSPPAPPSAPSNRVQEPAGGPSQQRNQMMWDAPYSAPQGAGRGGFKSGFNGGSRGGFNGGFNAGLRGGRGGNRGSFSSACASSPAFLRGHCPPSPCRGRVSFIDRSGATRGGCVDGETYFRGCVQVHRLHKGKRLGAGATAQDGRGTRGEEEPLCGGDVQESSRRRCVQGLVEQVVREERGVEENEGCVGG
ncbi:hypothetical protein C8R46DRAFT_1092381 [Mycena filopes]|nr:hypothetical protein C8R46DRAFT_1092381 [Mycena filopes]